MPAGGNVTVVGIVADTTITSLMLTHNGVVSTIPVQGGNFSTEVTLADANTITVGGTDSLGNPFSATLLLDGDMLPAAFEQAIGFDPLNADSDCSQWPGNQAGNGVIDGYEVFAGDLPVFAKYRIGADPFVVDTDGDGLTDSFELLKLGTFPEEPGLMSMMGDGDPIVVAAGTDDDPDGDGLSNLDEQTYGTDPLSADTDNDGLSDAAEIAMGTDPCDADTDGDGLADGAEVALGTNPNNPDSNGNGVPDGAEDYWSGKRFLNDALNLTVFGRGYAIANVSVAEVNYTHLIDEEILVSKVAAIGFGDDVESGTIEIAYDPTHVENASRLSIYRFDEDLGTFVNVSSTVDTANWVVSCAAAGSAKYAVLDSARWEALFEDEESLELLSGTEPYIARVWVRDSQTGEGVGGASVILFCGDDDWEDLETTTWAEGDLKGLTHDHGVYETNSDQLYWVEKIGYKGRYGLIHFNDGDSGVITTSPIHRVDAPTGNLTVTSTPSAGVVVSIDNIYYGSGVSNVELLEGEHTLVLTTPSSYYGTAIETVEITRNQHTSKHINLPLTSSCGNVRVICSEPDAAVFIDGFGVGVIPASGVLTEADVPSGARNITVTKEGFAPYSESVTVVSGQTSTVDVVLVPEDLDGDGLPDIKETGGYRDGYGRWHYSDPNAVDTDGDGLSDSYEAGFSFTVDGKTYQKSRSDPTKVDTDGDGLNDFWEDYWGTDAYNEDTDGDGLLDGEDDQPLIPANPVGDFLTERLRQEVAVRIGATFGETGLEGEKFGYLVGGWASHPYYALGWIASGIAVYGDVRDLIYAISQADTVGAAINGLGLAPYIGDSCKTAADVAKYLVKYPDNLLEIGRLLADQRVIQLLPDKDQLDVIDHFYLSATGRKVGTELATEYGLTGAQVAKIQGRGVKLDEVVYLIKVENGEIPTVIGNVNGGWTHLEGRHITGMINVGKEQTTLFPMQNQVTWYGEVYPGRSDLTVESLKQLINDGINSRLTDWPQGMQKIKYSVPDGEARYGIQEMIIIVNPNYGLASAYPLKGSQVYRWNAGTGKWDPTI